MNSRHLLPRRRVAAKTGFVAPLVTNIEFGRDHPDHVLIVEIGGHHIRDDEAPRVQRVQNMIDQRGLAGTHLARNDNKALSLLQPKPQMG